MRRARRSRAKSSRAFDDGVRRKKWNAAIIVFFGLALIGGAVFLYVFTKSERIELGEDLCPKFESERGITLVLIDQTDRLTILQQTDIKNKFGQLIREGVPKHARIEVYLFRDNAAALTGPVISLCNPGVAENWEQLYLNVDQVRLKFNKNYVEKLDQIVEDLVRFEDAPASPLFEAIQTLAIKVLNSPKLSKVNDRRLIVISDFVQNSPILNLYSQPLPVFEQFKRQSGFLQVRTRLTGVGLEMWVIKRVQMTALQTRGAFVEFWVSLFADQGAVVNKVRQVPET